jgi:hypothetical protein
MSINGRDIPLPNAATISATVGAGNYWTNSITDVTTNLIVSGSNLNVVLDAGTVLAILRNSSNRMDYAQIPVATYNLTIPAVSSTINTSISWRTACNDPRVKPVSNDWNPLAAGQPGTLGDGNSGTVFYGLTKVVKTFNIKGDGDSSCHEYWDKRDRGAMTPGELGFIHTGVPWRTLWLQPQQNDEGGPPPARPIPDWAAVDLFSNVDETNVIGRININQNISNSGTPLDGRRKPLDALLDNNGPAANIYSRLIAPSTRKPNLPFCQGTNIYTTVGELCEVSGVADSGADKFARETTVRKAINNATTRSNVFTIWAIAQSLANDGTTVTGETKVQAVVERRENPGYSTTDPRYLRLYILYYRYFGD